MREWQTEGLILGAPTPDPVPSLSLSLSFSVSLQPTTHTTWLVFITKCFCRLLCGSCLVQFEETSVIQLGTSDTPGWHSILYVPSYDGMMLTTSSMRQTTDNLMRLRRFWAAQYLSHVLCSVVACLHTSWLFRSMARRDVCCRGLIRGSFHG